MNTIINQFVAPESLEEQWDVKGLERALVSELNEEMPIAELLEKEDDLDDKWKESTMDYLRQGIHLRGYVAKKTKQEYKREAFELFSQK